MLALLLIIGAALTAGAFGYRLGWRRGGRAGVRYWARYGTQLVMNSNFLTGAERGIEIGYLIAQLAHPQYVLGPVEFANTPHEQFIPFDLRVADYRESYPAHVKYGIYPANSGGDTTT